MAFTYFNCIVTIRIDRISRLVGIDAAGSYSFNLYSFSGLLLRIQIVLCLLVFTVKGASYIIFTLISGITMFHLFNYNINLSLFRSVALLSYIWFSLIIISIWPYILHRLSLWHLTNVFRMRYDIIFRTHI